MQSGSLFNLNDLSDSLNLKISLSKCRKIVSCALTNDLLLPDSSAPSRTHQKQDTAWNLQAAAILMGISCRPRCQRWHPYLDALSTPFVCRCRAGFCKKKGLWDCTFKTHSKRNLYPLESVGNRFVNKLSIALRSDLLCVWKYVEWTFGMGPRRVFGSLHIVDFCPATRRFGFFCFFFLGSSFSLSSSPSSPPSTKQHTSTV